jgi:hypothetical protein
MIFKLVKQIEFATKPISSKRIRLIVFGVLFRAGRMGKKG